MRRQPVDNYVGPVTIGIDVSHWQGDIDWDMVATTPVKFAWIRTGDGKDEDRWFHDNWKEAKRVGLIRGVYHFFRADRDGRTQALMVVKMIREAGGFDPQDFTVALDFEGGVNKNLPGGVFEGGAAKLPIGLVVEEALEFMATIQEELGVIPMMYTAQAFHWWLSQARPDLAEQFRQFPLWLPSYSKHPMMPVDTDGVGFPWEQWTIWQHTSKGRVPGIDGDCDMNKFRGDEQQMYSYIQSLHPSQKKTPETVSEDPDLRAALFQEAAMLVAQLAEILADLAEPKKCQD
jgi:lysozyme